MNKLEKFLRRKLEEHPVYWDKIGEIDDARMEGEPFARVLVRLGILPEERLGLALKASWESNEALEKCPLFNEAAATLVETLREADFLEKTLEESLEEIDTPSGAVRSLLETTRHVPVKHGAPEPPGRPSLQEPFYPRRAMRLGHLMLLRPLDSGGSADVWKAWHENLRIHVAVKFLKPELDKPSYRERFLEEARKIARLNHPGIVRVYDCESAGNLAYIEVEFVAGCSLQTILNFEGSLSAPIALRVAKDMAIALKDAWEHGFIHRDVKPGNVMVAPDGAVKMMDFGLAEPVLEAAEFPESKSISWLAGTPAYMAPELIRKSAPPSVQSDIYALGVTIFQARAGRLPFPSATVAGMFREHLCEKPPRLVDAAPDSPALSALVERMLAKSPGDRPGSYGEVLEELGECARSDLEAGPKPWEASVRQELGQLCQRLN